MNEELDYGINAKGKPLLVVYPELTMEEIIETDGKVSDKARKLWSAVPEIEIYMRKVYTQYVPFDKNAIHEAHNRIDASITKS